MLSLKKLWELNLVYVLCLICIAAQTVVIAFFNIYLFFVSLVVFFLLFGIIVYRLLSERDRYKKLIKNVNDELQHASSNALSNFTIPIIVVSDADEIIWYNKAFTYTVTETPDDIIGCDLSVLISLEDQELMREAHRVEINYGGKVFRVFESFSDAEDIEQRIICFVDITALQKYAIEYSLTRPVVALLAVDNFDDVSRDLRDSERTALSSKIQNVLENWFSVTNGISKRLSGDRFMFIFEERYLNKFKADKFSILNEIRSLEMPNRTKATVSIGVGTHGADLRECEDFAHQALDMALGRGGDQVAIKNDDNNYQFFGGLSGASEKRTRVRTRIVASALVELINSSDRILLMGHRFSDMDCVGASFALQSAIKSLGKEVHVVLDRATTMAESFLQRVEELDKSVNITDPERLLPLINKDTLLIVLDTHRPHFVDNPAILEKASTVVVIDHHRKAVDFIDKAVIFYHETSASSTCEMVSELLQYINENSIERAEAEGLLAGIMLDTRNFVFNTGVRTFEASALLRKHGADPVEVKKMFADSLESYKIKSQIISTSEIYKDCAIAINVHEGPGAKIVTSQAADELLEIQGVASSYVLCRINNGINISARSLSDNVQIVMEKLGGGGSRTMAACQLAMDDLNKAREMLITAIDEIKEG